MPCSAALPPPKVIAVCCKSFSAFKLTSLPLSLAPSPTTTRLFTSASCTPTLPPIAVAPPPVLLMVGIKYLVLPFNATSCCLAAAEMSSSPFVTLLLASVTLASIFAPLPTITCALFLMLLRLIEPAKETCACSLPDVVPKTLPPAVEAAV